MKSSKLITIGIWLIFTSGSVFANHNGKLETIQVQKEALPQLQFLDGQVEAVNKSTISAQTSGVVTKLFYDVDDFVKKGKVLARIKAKSQRSNLQQAKASKQEAIASLATADARLKEAKAEFSRVKKVYDKQLISRAVYDKALAALETAKAARAAAASRVKSAKASVDKAGEQLAYTEVIAPYSGIVTERHVELGEVVNVGSPIMTGISLNKMRVLASIPQRLITKVRENNKGYVFFDDSSKPVKAKSLTFFPFADNASNTFKVRLELPETKQNLFPGTFVKVAFDVGSLEKTMVPEKAVAYRGEVTGIYVVDDKGMPSLRQVRLGRPSVDGQLQVLAGLDEGETIAIDPVHAAIFLKQHRAMQKSEKSEGDKHE